jgi:hypothetical protein
LSGRLSGSLVLILKRLIQQTQQIIDTCLRLVIGSFDLNPKCFPVSLNSLLILNHDWTHPLSQSLSIYSCHKVATTQTGKLSLREPMVLVGDYAGQ